MSDDRTTERETGSLLGLGAPRRSEAAPPTNLPQRPNYLPEEGEVGRSDFWHLAKSVALLLLGIAAIGLLLGALR